MNTTEKTNDLRFTTTKVVGNESITVKIRLNDECKNGIEDFSITGEIYKAGKPRTGRNMITAGCIHEEIARAFPEFIPFIRLHLADWQGIPMYAVENGFYHLKNGFNNEAAGTPEHATKFCEYYRMAPAQFEALKNSETSAIYGFYLVELGIVEQWKNEAAAAIKKLEGLTGKIFEGTGTRSNTKFPTPEEIAASKN